MGASKRLTELEKIEIMVDAILDELAMGTVFFCGGRQLTKPPEIADAMISGREVVVEYHCKWCGVPCDHSHWCKEHNLFHLMIKGKQW